MERFSLTNTKFPTYSAGSKMNPFTTQTSVVPALRKDLWKREDEHLRDEIPATADPVESGNSHLPGILYPLSGLILVTKSEGDTVIFISYIRKPKSE